MIRSERPEVIREVKEEHILTQEEIDYLKYVEGN